MLEVLVQAQRSPEHTLYNELERRQLTLLMMYPKDKADSHSLAVPHGPLRICQLRMRDTFPLMWQQKTWRIYP